MIRDWRELIYDDGSTAWEELSSGTIYSELPSGVSLVDCTEPAITFDIINGLTCDNNPISAEGLNVKHLGVLETNVCLQTVEVPDLEGNGNTGLNDYDETGLTDYTKEVEALPIATEIGTSLSVHHQSHLQEYYQGDGDFGESNVHMKVAFPTSYISRTELQTQTITINDPRDLCGFGSSNLYENGSYEVDIDLQGGESWINPEGKIPFVKLWAKNCDTIYPQCGSDVGNLTNYGQTEADARVVFPASMVLPIQHAVRDGEICPIAVSAVGTQEPLDLNIPDSNAICGYGNTSLYGSYDKDIEVKPGESWINPDGEVPFVKLWSKGCDALYPQCESDVENLDNFGSADVDARVVFPASMVLPIQHAVRDGIACPIAVSAVEATHSITINDPDQRCGYGNDDSYQNFNYDTDIDLQKGESWINPEGKIPFVRLWTKNCDLQYPQLGADVTEGSYDGSTNFGTTTDVNAKVVFPASMVLPVQNPVDDGDTVPFLVTKEPQDLQTFHIDTDVDGGVGAIPANVKSWSIAILDPNGPEPIITQANGARSIPPVVGSISNSVNNDEDNLTNSVSYNANGNRLYITWVA